MNENPITVLLAEDRPDDVQLVRAALDAAEGAKFVLIPVNRLTTAIQLAREPTNHAALRPSPLPAKPRISATSCGVSDRH